MPGQRLSREERNQLAQRRLILNLEALGVANMRTLEMKIADAGPNHMRVNPHVITRVRRTLEEAGHLRRAGGGLWIHRSVTPKEIVDARLALLRPIYDQTVHGAFTSRMGQSLEIAISRALDDSPLQYVGGFIDLDEHDDSTNYRKEEPPLRFSGRRMPGESRFDFLAFHPVAGPIGIEAKNLREWLYPDRDEVKELLFKAVSADTLPVLIGRRIPYVTFRLLQTAGVMLFENYNQLYPLTDAVLAVAVRDKTLLGYADVRAGNQPNPNLKQFLQQTLPANAVEYRARFDRYSDLLFRFATGDLSYAGFAARIRRREQGRPENTDNPRDDAFDPDDVEDGW